MQAAYEALPEEMKQRLIGLKALQQYRYTRGPEHPESRWKVLTEEECQTTPEVDLCFSGDHHGRKGHRRDEGDRE